MHVGIPPHPPPQGAELPWDQAPPRDQAPPCQQTATVAEGTHPTGMHSCDNFLLYLHHMILLNVKLNAMTGLQFEVVDFTDIDFISNGTPKRKLAILWKVWEKLHYKLKIEKVDANMCLAKFYMNPISQEAPEFHY